MLKAIFFGQMSLQVLCPFSSWVVSFCCWVTGFHIFWILVSYQIHDLQIFPPICGLSLLSRASSDAILHFDKIQFIYFFFCCLCFWYHIQEITTKSNVTKMFPYSSESFIVLAKFRFLIHFELGFVTIRQSWQF